MPLAARLVDPDSAIDLRQWEQRAAGLAPASLQALLSDLLCFSAFCQLRAAAGLPAAPGTTIGYIVHLEQAGRKPSTIARHLSSVKSLHALAGLTLPGDGGEVRAAMKALRLRHREGSHAARGLRLNEAALDEDGAGGGQPLPAIGYMLMHCGNDLQGLRDTALLTLAYEMGLRPAELTALRVEHLVMQADGRGWLHLPAVAGAGQGEGREVPRETMIHVQRWLQAADLSGGPLFRRVMIDRRKAREARRALSIADLAPNARIDAARMAARKAEPARVRYTVGAQALTSHGVTHILRRLARKAIEGQADASSLDRLMAGISARSLRIGLAQDLLAAGEAMGSVTEAMRWTSPITVRRHARTMAEQKREQKEK